MVVSLLKLILTKKTYIFRNIYEIFRHIKQSTKTTLINKIWTRLIGLEFKLDNIINQKTMKFLVQKILPDYK